MTDQKHSESDLKGFYRQFTAIMDSLDALIYVADFETYEVLFVNKYGRDIWGDLVGKTCWKTIQSGQAGPCDFCTNDRLVSDQGVPAETYVWQIQNTVDHQWYECRDRAIEWTDGRLVRLEIATNVTKHKEQEEQSEVLLDNLTRALVEVKRLSGLLPICSGCKKIRDDNGYWEQVDVYIRNHSEADFSHGICPDCRDELYGDLKTD